MGRNFKFIITNPPNLFWFEGLWMDLKSPTLISSYFLTNSGGFRITPIWSNLKSFHEFEFLNPNATSGFYLHSELNLSTSIANAFWSLSWISQYQVENVDSELIHNYVDVCGINFIVEFEKTLLRSSLPEFNISISSCLQILFCCQFVACSYWTAGWI